MLDWPRLSRALLLFTGSGLATGIAAHLLGYGDDGDLLWAAVIAVALVYLLASTTRQLLHGQIGVDVIAILAMAGAIALHEYLAGAVVGLMLSTGVALEEYAGARAERELSALLRRAPRIAHRMEDHGVIDVPVETVVRGDRLLVKESDAVPVDGIILSDAAMLDESALTGESRMVERERGEPVASGVLNAGGMFEIRATASAEASTYAGIIRLVQTARASKSPFARLADRYAALFVPLTLAVAAAAWIASGDPVRAFAVLVVATPCPLLLAVPIAIVCGISRAARRGIILRDGGALETLGQARLIFFDKTGTLTVGAPRLVTVTTVRGGAPDEVLRLAASLAQTSSHVISVAIVRAALERGLRLDLPVESQEALGGGIQGVASGHRIALGSMRWVVGQTTLPADTDDLERRIARHRGSNVIVALDGAIAGALLLEDDIRADTPRTIRELKHLGFRDITMLTGDRPEAAESIGVALGLDRILASQSPESKLQAVVAARATGTTVMVGDGINDAAALASADVGVAMGARGATASSEAADIVITVDRLDRLPEAVRIARRTRRIARQSVLLGMSLSFVAMLAAALGWLAPVAGALLQEGIDAASILWALTALADSPGARRRRGLPAEVAQRLRHEHRALDAEIDGLGVLADRLDDAQDEQPERRIADAAATLNDVLLPHEREDEQHVYPILRTVLGDDDALSALSRTHRELFLRAGEFTSLQEHLRETGPTSSELLEARRLLYGLHAVFRLHNAQEEELFDLLSAE